MGLSGPYTGSAGNMIQLRDALQDRNLVDRWAFMGFALVGGVLIWLLKATTDLKIEYITGGAAAFMALYAWVVSSRGSGKLRSDQAGDNCYYLGLIFTLVSLAHAIFTFDPANTATTIVNGFGIALTTTIFGLLLRVMFNQMRVDLYETEDSARLELADAAGRLKTRLGQISNDFADFALRLQQGVDELRQTAADSISASSRESLDVFRAFAAEATTELKSETAALTANVAELTKASTATVRALNKHAESISNLGEQQATSVGTLKAIEGAATAVTQATELVAQRLSQTATSQDALNTAASGVATSMAGLQRTVQDNIGALDALNAEFKQRLQDLETGPRATLDSALNSIANAADRLKASIESLATKHSDAAKSIEGLTSGVVGAVQAHNSELEQELGRSRDNVSKVHGSLVAMTTELAGHVEKLAAQ